MVSAAYEPTGDGNARKTIGINGKEVGHKQVQDGSLKYEEQATVFIARD